MITPAALLASTLLFSSVETNVFRPNHQRGDPEAAQGARWLKKRPTCASIWRPQDANGASTTPRRLDSGDVYFSHRHHSLKRALCFITASRQRVSQVRGG